MFLCLSSGASPRYREDVLRALAQPWGSILQFRYLRRYLAPGILEKAKAADKKKPQALIAYIDLSDTNRVPEIIPCRFALISEITIVGTAVTLQLELQEFAVAADLSKFNDELKEKSVGTLPLWQADGDKKRAKGDYWLEVPAEPASTVRSVKLEDWEMIVTQLAARDDFKEEGSFYTVVGINEIPSRSAVLANNGRYEFKPGHEYELSLYHFYPKEVPLRAGVTLTTTSQWLAFITNPVLQLDSRYDLKHGRFKAGKPTNKADAWISVMRNAGKDQLPYVDFDLLCLVRGVFWRTLGYGIILGLFLAGPQIIAALSNPSLPASNVVLVCAASGILGLAAGILAAFGLKKSL
jgi:hypothetical protein